MIISSIDVLGGHAVQLVGGDPKSVRVDAGPPADIAARWGRTGPLAAIDLDAALGRGDNREVIEDLCRRHRCRVGGGIRSVDRALQWLDAGAERVILGTAARPEILGQLPRDRVMAAIDARDQEVVTHGWTEGTGRKLLDDVAALRPYVGGFLVTVVEREGRLGGTDLELARKVAQVAEDRRVTWAGGIRSADEVAALDRAGLDAQVGMAMYTGAFEPVDAVWACLRSDRADGLIPTVVVDEFDRALGLVYSNEESLREAVASGRGVYHSRSRGGLWKKGESSGAVQELLRIDVDCDRDALRFRVRQHGAGFCHLDTWTCWGDGGGVPALDRTLEARKASAPEGSYTARLFQDEALLASKLREEARELVDAQTREEAVHEAADVLYFSMVRLAGLGGRWADVERELDRRAAKVSRRKGDAKPNPAADPGGSA